MAAALAEARDALFTPATLRSTVQRRWWRWPNAPSTPSRAHHGERLASWSTSPPTRPPPWGPPCRGLYGDDPVGHHRRHRRPTWRPSPRHRRRRHIVPLALRAPSSCGIGAAGSRGVPAVASRFITSSTGKTADHRRTQPGRPVPQPPPHAPPRPTRHHRNPTRPDGLCFTDRWGRTLAPTPTNLNTDGPIPIPIPTSPEPGATPPANASTPAGSPSPPTLQPGRCSAEIDVRRPGPLRGGQSAWRRRPGDPGGPGGRCRSGRRSFPHRSAAQLGDAPLGDHLVDGVLQRGHDVARPAAGRRSSRCALPRGRVEHDEALAPLASTSRRGRSRPGRRSTSSTRRRRSPRRTGR